MCLISGPRQSAGAHALWRALASRHELGYVDLRDRRLEFLGPRVDRETLGDLHARMVLLGRGWSFEELMHATGARPSSAGDTRLRSHYHRNLLLPESHAARIRS